MINLLKWTCLYADLEFQGEKEKNNKKKNTSESFT